MVLVTKDSVGGIDSHPARTREVNLRPGMQGPFGHFLPRAEFAEIATGKACGKTVGAQGGRQEHGKVPAGPTSQAQSFLRFAGSSFLTPLVGEILVEGIIQLNQDRESRDRVRAGFPEREDNGPGDFPIRSQHPGFLGLVGKGKCRAWEARRKSNAFRSVI